MNKITYEVCCFIEVGEFAEHITGIRTKKEAFATAKKLKATKKYETIYVQSIDEEEIKDDWLI
jgi:hypothetical protein